MLAMIFDKQTNVVKGFPSKRACPFEVKDLRTKESKKESLTCHKYHSISVLEVFFAVKCDKRGNQGTEKP